jgi:hypothetical protein
VIWSDGVNDHDQARGRRIAYGVQSKYENQPKKTQANWPTRVIDGQWEGRSRRAKRDSVSAIDRVAGIIRSQTAEWDLSEVVRDARKQSSTRQSAIGNRQSPSQLCGPIDCPLFFCPSNILDKLHCKSNSYV